MTTLPTISIAPSKIGFGVWKMTLGETSNVFFLLVKSTKDSNLQIL